MLTWRAEMEPTLCAAPARIHGSMDVVELWSRRAPSSGHVQQRGRRPWSHRRSSRMRTAYLARRLRSDMNRGASSAHASRPGPHRASGAFYLVRTFCVIPLSVGLGVWCGDSCGKLHAIAAALSQRNKVLEARRHTPGTGSVAAMMTAQAHAVQRSASKLAGVTHTMTRGHMLDEEPAAEEPAAEEPAAEEPAAAPEPEATPEGQIKDTSDEAMESEIGNLKPTGIMGVFFSGHTFIIAISIILSLIVAICCFARYADCALT